MSKAVKNVDIFCHAEFSSASQSKRYPKTILIFIRTRFRMKFEGIFRMTLEGIKTPIFAFKVSYKRTDCKLKQTY
jgi:hypothetical protein